MDRKEIAILTLIMLLSVIAWIVFGVSHARETSTVSEVQLRQIVPLTPTFDNEIIETIEKREE